MVERSATVLFPLCIYTPNQGLNALKPRDETAASHLLPVGKGEKVNM